MHAAVLTNPRRDGAYAHELESIGTLNVLAAAAAAGVGHVVLRSFTAVYGAHGRNPAFLTEDRPLQPNLSLGWARDKLEAEQHAASFARRYPGMKITVLRFAPLFGPGVRNFYTAIFDHRLVPVLMGYDPLMQLLHPDDALAAFLTAVERRAGGRFQRRALAAHPAAHRAAPGGQGTGARPAPDRVPGRGPACGRRGSPMPPAGSSTSCVIRSSATATRRGASWGSRRATPAATRWTRTCAIGTRAARCKPAEAGA